MKKLFLSLAIISSVALTSCGGKTETVNASEAQATANASEGSETFVVDTATSTVNWKGGKTFDDIKKPEEGHWGVVKLKDGTVTTKDGKLESGKFTADFTSFESKDLDADPETKAKLDGHLKAADFIRS